MAIESGYYIVSREIAVRTGDFDNRYRAADGRYVIDVRALSRIRLSPEEYVTGLAGIEKISREEAMTLIAEGGYMTGDNENPKAAGQEEDLNEKPETEETAEEEIPEEEAPEEEEEKKEETNKRRK